MKAILLSDGIIGSAEIIEFTDSLEFYYKTIECDCIAFATAFGASNIGDYDLIVDDDGLFKPNAQINVPASLLYGFKQHGQPIVGKALVVKTDDDGNTIGLTDADIKKVLNFIIHQ